MATKRTLFFWMALVFTTGVAFAHEEHQIPDYERLQLTDIFLAEGANSGDFNRDGVTDIVAGPYWYAGPKFVERFEYYKPVPFDINGYSDNFFSFSCDVDRDGWTDIVVIGFPGKEARWYRNPAGKLGHWPVHIAYPEVDNESPTFADITGDGRPELVFHTKGRLGFAQINQDDPTQKWEFQAVSEPRDMQRYTHGLGYGDLNGDGRTDLLMKDGWWEQPAELEPNLAWPFHPVAFAGFGGAQMLVSDVDGDGDNDVITSKHAHGYGLAWFENIPGDDVSGDDVSGDSESVKFLEHSIMGEHPQDSPHGVAFSQLHALTMADMNGDGIDDIVTGKRFWAHKGRDAGGHDPAVLYCFLTVREKNKTRFEPQRIDTNSGVGTQVVAHDINKDGVPDIVIGNKKGTFVYVSHSHPEEEHAEATRKPLGPADYPYAGLSAEDAAQVMDVPDGFSVNVFAAEPDVKQPIAMTIDDRGRVWIAEAYEYPQRAPEGEGRDRILIFEDTDGDGRFDRRKIFAEGLNLVSGLEVGFGGVWVGAAPYFMFIPDRDGDDVPDSAPEVLLDGWGYQDTHETLNAFIWGPDGWLYGCHGVFTHSKVGKPGTPDDQRAPINAGIWRYHPTRHTFEVFAHGTSNPWGVDFNDHGQAICTACVIPHLFHIIQGGRYFRQAGTHFNPHTYDDIDTIADHKHYAGDIGDHASWGREHPEKLQSTDEAGGGHAHAGAMIYLGGSWPEEYRSQILMNNIHGARLNRDQLVPNGSGFIGSHCSDFLLSHDRASQIIYFRYGPGGQVYFIDWYDMQACHHREVSKHDRANGRIFRVAYNDAPPVQVDLKQLSDVQLVEQLLHTNDWYVRHARRILQERASTGKLDLAVRGRMEFATIHSDETRRLRAMWALHVTGGLEDRLIARLLGDEDEHVRAWTVQLALDQEQPEIEKWLPKFVELAANDPSPVVRLYLASAMQRVPLNNRWEVLQNLASHGEDASDHNLPLMIWYAAEPLAEIDTPLALELALSDTVKIPRLREFMVRRVASIASPEALAALVQSLDDSSATATANQIAVLQGALKGLSGHATVEMPKGWKSVYSGLANSENEKVRSLATALGVKFGDSDAKKAFRNVLQSGESQLDFRREAMASLLAAHDRELVPTLLQLTSDPAIRDLALAGLARYDDPQIPAGIFAIYPELPLSHKRIALSTLASREPFAIEMLKAVAEDRIPEADIPADLVRQLHNLKNEEIDGWIGKTWGQIRATAADKLKLARRYHRVLRHPVAKSADLSLGRAVFENTCQQCHKLYGVGNNVGPNLTGSNRANADYLITNIVDPSGLITKEYQSTILSLDSGRVVTGVVVAEDDNSVTLRNATETVVIPITEIEERVLSEVSMMPEDQLKQYSDLEFVSLIAYLQSKEQVPLLATKENASQLFNGKDLTGWKGEAGLWSVEDGEIVGKSPGLSHNSFLISDMVAADFHLTLEVKLVDNVGNSGIQFRSRHIGDAYLVAGYQADIGVGWWGKLYHEHGRALLWEKSGEAFVKNGQWNKYEILADGSKVQTWINGNLCVDLDDPAGESRGIIALQLHSGKATEVRFRNIRLEILSSE